MRGKIAKVLSGAAVGFDGALIEVEADMKSGLPGLQVVGMGNKAIDEARQRVRSAISNSSLQFPAQKITVNLAPAELPKDGTSLDLPIALSILAASGQLIKTEVKDALFAGELALDGSLRPIRGAIFLAELAHKHGLKRIYLPLQNVSQARLVPGIEVIGVSSLHMLYGLLKGFTRVEESPALSTSVATSNAPLLPIDAIIGHEQAKRALTIAAAGRHNILFSGPPGAGKTMLARCLAGLLPPLNSSETTEVTKIHSLSDGDSGLVYTHPPLRDPHHTVTLTALIGGGLRPRPGDISLAHKGVLFLDELPEYPRATLEALRQPLEDRAIHLSRLYGRISWPADFLLAATMNPCPCGFYGDDSTPCTCSGRQIDMYRKKISGPLLDRIDIRLTLGRISHEHFFDTNSLKNTQHLKVLKLVLIAREAQKNRYNRSDRYNAYATFDEANRLFCITNEAQKLLTTAAKSMKLTSRGMLKTLRVARTIADLEMSGKLESGHVAEALQFR